MRAALCIGQLHVDAGQITGPADAAFKNIADAELTAELFNVDGLALVGKGGVAGYDKAARDPREVGSQVVGDPVDETFQIQVVREVGKWQYDDRQRRHGGRYGGLGAGMLPHRADETDALADNRADQPLPVAAVAYRVSSGVDPAEQRRFRHD